MSNNRGKNNTTALRQYRETIARPARGKDPFYLEQKKTRSRFSSESTGLTVAQVVLLYLTLSACIKGAKSEEDVRLDSGRHPDAQGNTTLMNATAIATAAILPYPGSVAGEAVHADLAENPLAPYIPYCKQAIQTANMPRGVTFGAKQGYIQPASCVEDTKSELCTKEKMVVTEHRKDSSYRAKIEPMRAEKSRHYEKWSSKLMAKLPADMSTEEVEVVNQLGRLKHAINSVAVSLKHGIGNCAEHSYHSLQRIIDAAIDGKIAIDNVQIYTFQTASGKNPFPDHVFVVINGSPVIIDSSNPYEIATYLRNLPQQAVICDAWNNEHVSSFITDKTGLYDVKKAEWHKLKVMNIAFDFNLVKSIRPSLRDTICKELKNLSEKIYAYSPCRLFTTQTSQAETAPHPEAKKAYS